MKYLRADIFECARSISESKLRFALFKGMTQHYIRKYLGNTVYELIGNSFAKITETMYNAFN